VTIADNDATTISIAATDSSASETATDNGLFTVSLSNGKVAPVGGLTVNYAVSGSATPTTDYAALSGSVVIPAGTSSATINVNGIVDDNIVEGDETVTVTLTSTSIPSQVTVDATPATVTIADNDATTISIAATDANASETATDNGLFTVSLSNGKVAPVGGLTVNYAVSGSATPTTDYAALTGSVVIPAGASSATINVSSIVDDSIVEGDETVTVTLTGTSIPSQVAVDATPATVTIADNDSTTISIAATDASASETATDNGLFTVSLSNGKVAPVGGLTVNYAVSGSATPTTDYA